MSTLYIVATPIGNLEDITLRALRVLSEVFLIAAEDTRTTRKLLSHYDIDTPSTSYHDHNRVSKLPALLEALSQGDVALVSDAGTPAISDPGAELAVAAHGAGHTVVPIPGPSSLTAALSVAGIDTDQFIYLGFLPRRGGPRRRLFESLVGEPRDWIAFEAPHRVIDALTDIRKHARRPPSRRLPRTDQAARGGLPRHRHRSSSTLLSSERRVHAHRPRCGGC